MYYWANTIELEIVNELLEYAARALTFESFLSTFLAHYTHVYFSY